MSDRPSSHAHKLVKETAVAMAHELYDTLMQDDRWYQVWKRKTPHMTAKQREQAFIDRNLGRLLPQARATLAQMLRSTADVELQNTIYEALLLDATLVRGRTQ